MIFPPILRACLVLVFSLMLLACGGGGGSDSNTSNNTGSPASGETVINGRA